MRRLQDTSAAVLAGLVVLTVACAPRATQRSATSEPAARCDGIGVLDIQNDLGEDVEIYQVPGTNSRGPTPVVIVGKGWHTVEIGEIDDRWYFARVVGQSPYTSYALRRNDPRVRITVRCSPTGVTALGA